MNGREIMSKIRSGLAFVVLVVLVGCTPAVPVLVRSMPTQAASTTPSSTVVLSTPKPVVVPTFPVVTSTVSVIPTVTISTPSISTVTATVMSTVAPSPIYITKEEIREGTVWLEIPKIRVKAPIELADVIYTKAGPSFDLPKENPKWVPDWSSEIGLPGIALIYGHRQWGPFPKVFTNLDDLKPKDKAIVISTKNRFTYEVVETMVVNPEDIWQVIFEHDQQAKKDGESKLMLLTCTPWGTDWQRLVVFLTLEEVSDAS